MDVAVDVALPPALPVVASTKGSLTTGIPATMMAAAPPVCSAGTSSLCKALAAALSQHHAKRRSASGSSRGMRGRAAGQSEAPAAVPHSSGVGGSGVPLRRYDVKPHTVLASTYSVCDSGRTCVSNGGKPSGSLGKERQPSSDKSNLNTRFGKGSVLQDSDDAMQPHLHALLQHIAALRQRLLAGAAPQGSCNRPSLACVNLSSRKDPDDLQPKQLLVQWGRHSDTSAVALPLPLSSQDIKAHAPFLVRASQGALGPLQVQTPNASPSAFCSSSAEGQTSGHDDRFALPVDPPPHPLSGAADITACLQALQNLQAPHNSSLPPEDCQPHQILPQGVRAPPTCSPPRQPASSREQAYQWQEGSAALPVDKGAVRELGGGPLVSKPVVTTMPLVGSALRESSSGDRGGAPADGPPQWQHGSNRFAVAGREANHLPARSSSAAILSAGRSTADCAPHTTGSGCTRVPLPLAASTISADPLFAPQELHQALIAGDHPGIPDADVICGVRGSEEHARQWVGSHGTGGLSRGVAAQAVIRRGGQSGGVAAQAVTHRGGLSGGVTVTHRGGHSGWVAAQTVTHRGGHSRVVTAQAVTHEGGQSEGVAAQAVAHRGGQSGGVAGSLLPLKVTLEQMTRELLERERRMQEVGERRRCAGRGSDCSNPHSMVHGISYINGAAKEGRG